MVTLRGKADADPESDRPDSGAPSPQASPKSAVLTVSNRAKTSGPSNGFLSEDDGQKHVEDEDGNPLRTITRRSPRLRNTGGSDGVNGKRRKVRRSTRPTRPTCRYQASPNMADSISTNVAEVVLKRADDMKKRRQLSSSEEGICSEAQRRKTLSEDLNGEDEEDDEEEDDEEDDEEDEEEGVAADSDNGSGSQSFDAILNGASGRFQASNSESLRGSYRISASGPNTTTRTYRIWATSRTTKSAWASKSGSSDEDADSDDDEQRGGKIPGRSAAR